jgi:RNA polymerase sigma factor (sigma-70 family)
MSESPPSRESPPVLDLAGLYERERAPMIHLACLLVGSRSVAEEIVQDAFVVVGERWAVLEKPGGYLRSTVVNGCRMALRRRVTERRYAYGPSETIDAPTELIELRSALDQLSERGRAAIVLRYFVDLPDAEIAELLGCRVATVRSIVRRSLLTLRKELS